MTADVRILIIDKDAAARRIVQRVLHDACFDVIDVECREEACALCFGMKVDVLLLNVNIGEREGPESCAVLRSQAPRAAIVVLSECDDPDQRVKALDAGQTTA